MNGRVLIEKACAFTGVPVSVLMGRGRSSRLVMIRQCLIFVLIRECGYSSIEVGRLLRRDSSNARHLLATAEFRIEREAAYGRLYAHLINELKVEELAS